MKVTIQQSGGFVGIAQPPLTIDTAQLRPEDRASVERLIKSVDFFRLPATAGQAPPVGDLPEHSIEVQTGTETHSVRVRQGASQKLDELVHVVRLASNRDSA
jgi:hypothetical protein